MTQQKEKYSKIVYPYKNNLYINLTNRCTAECVYCIKRSWQGLFRGHSLHITQEPGTQEVLDAINKYPRGTLKEFVFCGYGEPFIRIEVLKEIAKYLKEQGYQVRVNTSGHANLIHKRNIVPELKNLVDSISVSLNAENPEQYAALHKPVFGIQTFDAILDFIRECKKIIPQVILTTIELPENFRPGMSGINVEQCRAIARELGVEFRVRPYLDAYEDS